MKNIAWLAIGTLLVSSVTLSDEPNPYSGAWNIDMVNKKGKLRKGTLILKNKDGTWDIDWMSVKHACVGLKSPVVIKEASEDRLEFEIKRSEALRGCSDNTAIMMRVNETTLEGMLDDGRKLTLVRK